MDGMKSNPDFAAISAVLKENLDLVGSPVAVKIVTAPEQIPAGVPEIEETVRHCRMISLAREGKIFYATDAKHQWSVPNLPQETYATMYAPLEKAEFAPDIVMIFAKPKSMLKLAQSVLFRLGGRIYPQFSGIQSVCSDATAYVLLSGKPNFSLGCDGSRKFSGIADEEMVVGFPVEMIEEVAAILPTVVNAAGSKK